MRLLTQSTFVYEDDCAAFFLGFLNAGPGLALPGTGCLFVALPSFADRSVRAPVQRPQDFSDVAFMVVDAELVGDQTSDTRAGDVLQLSKSGKRAIGRVDRAPSHAATSNSLLMN